MTWIPCCMGTAAACGCGKSLAEIKSYCTCEKPSRGDRIAKLEREYLKKQIEAINSTVPGSVPLRRASRAFGRSGTT